MSKKKKPLVLDASSFANAIAAQDDFLKAATGQIRFLGLASGTKLDPIFPPESPSNKRRGRGAFSPAYMQTALGILDTKDTGRMNDFLKAEIIEACRNADAKFFRRMADIAEHIENTSTPLSAHARHVIAAKKVAVAMIEKGKEPTKQKLREIVTKHLGNGAFDNDQRWAEVFKSAGLGYLRARPPAKKAAKVKEKTR
jgi:hypothetical protein